MSLAVVTGANRGIGLELVRLLRSRGDDVVAAVRRSSPELDGSGARVEAGLDMADDAAPAELARRLQGARLQLLLLNAGILERDALDALDLASIRRQFEVNALGPLKVASALASNLAPGSKVALVTSRMGSIGDNTSGGRYGYRMSKAALNMAGVSLARDLAPQGVSVCIVHPGFVRTGMTGNAGQVAPADAARGVLARIDAVTPETSGGFWHANGERLPW